MSCAWCSRESAPKYFFDVADFRDSLLTFRFGLVLLRAGPSLSDSSASSNSPDCLRNVKGVDGLGWSCIWRDICRLSFAV